MTADGPRLYMKHSNEAQEPWSYMKTEKFNPNNPVKYMEDEERAMHEITFDSNGFVNNNGSFLAKKEEEERTQMKDYTGALIFVQGTDKKLYAAAKIRHYVQHSSFFSGGVVRNAGLMYLVNGKISAIAWQSGHYIRMKNSSRKHAVRMVKHLEDAFGISPDRYFVSDRYIEYVKKEEKFEGVTVSRDIPVEKYKILRASEFLKDVSGSESYTHEDFFDPKNARALQTAIAM